LKTLHLRLEPKLPKAVPSISMKKRLSQHKMKMTTDHLSGYCEGKQHELKTHLVANGWYPISNNNKA
jgi:hypothetical protein